jgi:DNA adenine methylase
MIRANTSKPILSGHHPSLNMEKTCLVKDRHGRRFKMRRKISLTEKIEESALEEVTYLELSRFDNMKRPPPPLLKWIGSKQWIAPTITSYMPQRYNTYIEPFVGSGAVLGALAPRKAIAGDNLKPLIEIWQLLQKNPESLLKHYTTTRNAYLKSPQKTYERVKSSYNESPNAHDLLFISRSCYGGVIRFTKEGTISTPIGMQRPISPRSLKRRMELWRIRVAGTRFIHADFSETMKLATDGDIVYCDPPYQYSQQILYGSQNFRILDLLNAIRKCKERGSRVMLSIDGKVKSERVDLKLHFPEGLFEREILVERGSSMLRRFQKKGSNMKGEMVHDRLLLTWSPNAEKT